MGYAYCVRLCVSSDFALTMLTLCLTGHVLDA
jgi:hypothetical protein